MKYDTLEKARQENRAPWTDVIVNTKDFVVYRDKFPVTQGHTLVVPKINNVDELLKCFRYAVSMGNENVEADNNITGYNVGINVGTSAGQTCMYPHVHLIFRRDGDIKDPTGGVRNVIPARGNYKAVDTIDWENLAVAQSA